MADAAVEFLLSSVKDLLLYHINLISGAQDELKQLESDLRSMRAYLKDASDKKIKNELFKEYVRQIRKVVYEVEDTIDTCITKAAAIKAKNMIRRYFSAERVNFAKLVKDLKNGKVSVYMEHIKAANASHDTNGKGANAKGKREKPPREEHVVGLEEETNTVIKYLMEESNQMDVISITGMPGIGKTTLAWKIYNDTRIREVFPKVIWIYLSKNFDIKDVLLTILKKFPEQDKSTKSSTIRELEEMIVGCLERKKFLIFIDDVWTFGAWEEIKVLLPKSNTMGYKVLMTSRYDKVARQANRRRPPHKLQVLDINKSWELLQLEVFDRLDNNQFMYLEDIGKQIAKDCEGHPLAIEMIGKVLAEIISAAEGSVAIKNKWKNVHESINICLNHEDKEKRIKNMISLSYTSLDYDLRNCFLYLGIFPKGSKIPVWKLTQLWIAEGFIDPKSSGMSVEGIAQNNLNELIDRNLLIVDKRKLDGTVKTCCVHNIVSEFCRNESALGKSNLFHEIRMSEEGTFVPLNEIQNCRRLCIHSSVHKFLLGKPEVKHTRSFLGFSKVPIDLVDNDISAITDAFDFLKVLDANTIRFPSFPSKLISKLVHLRYITLSADKITVLPKVMSNLYNLQTLIVDTQSPTLKIEANVWKMIQLKYFKTKASIILKKNGKGKGGENLQTLGRLSPESCTVDVFNKARNLKKLGIQGQLATLCASDCLEKLKRLEKLKLVNNKVPLQGLPRAFPPKLRILTLSGTNLDWSHMSSTLGKIPNLEVLKLKDNAFMGNCWEAVGGGFHELELFYIEGSKLKTWTASGEPFPNLRSLILKNCQDLEKVPLKQLGKYIEMLSMERVNQSAISAAEKEKEQGQGRTGMSGLKLVIVPEHDT